VPGPREPLYWMGRRLEEIIPYVPIASTVRTGISIFSYDGTITFGVTADYAANPDVDVLARGIEHGVSELLLAAEQHEASAPSRANRSRPAPHGNGSAPAKKAAPRKAAPAKAAPVKAAPRKAAPAKAAPRKAAPRKAAPRKAAPRKAAPPRADGSAG